MPKAERYGKLTPEVVGWLAANKGVAKRASFYRWVRRDSDHGRGTEHEFAPLRRGEAVRWTTIELFREYLADVKKYVPAGPFAEEAVPPPGPDPLSEPELWGGKPGVGWTRFITQVSERFVPSPSAMCAGERTGSTSPPDIRAAAELCVDWIGRLTVAGLGSQDGPPRSVGEREMRRTADAFACWLAQMWRADPHTVLFPVVDGTRVGVNIILPLKAESYARFKRGEVWDFDLTAADLELPSRTLLLFMLAESPGRGLPKGKRRRLEQLRTAVYQMAAFSPRGSEFCRPAVLSIAGTPEGTRWLTGFGFSDLGVSMPVTPRGLYELSPTGADTVPGTVNYACFRAAIEVFQSFLEPELANAEARVDR